MSEPVVYVVSRWGEPTQTFVRREAFGLLAQGTPIEARSLKRPLPVSPEIPCVHLTAVAVARGVALALVRRPGATMRAFATVLSRSALRNVPRQLTAALVGVAWGADPALRGVRLHSHFGWVAATAAWAAAGVSGSRFDVVLHAFELHKPELVDRFTPIPLRAAEQLFVISEADRDLLARRWGLEATVVRMGVPDDWILDRPDQGARDDRLVVAVGSLAPKKGHDVLLRALARSRHPWRLVVVGEGPERDRLQALARGLHLEERVRLAGRLSEDEVRDLLSRAAVGALACRESADGDRDGIPVALMEAMARGAAVVTTTVGAIPELVEGVGVLVPPDDPDALADALDALSDALARRRLATVAMDRVREGWTVSRQVATISGRAPTPPAAGR